MSWIAAGVATLLSALWIGIVVDGNQVWSAFAFTMIAASADVGVLLLTVVPAGILCFREKQRRDRHSLVLAGGSFVVLLVECLLLHLVIPMRGE